MFPNVFIFQSAGISYLSPNLLKENTLVRFVDLSDNVFTKLPSDFLFYQTALSEITLYNIDWDCTCDLLWWVEYSLSQNVTVIGDKMCNNVQGL
jgi:hypothetical protein